MTYFFFAMLFFGLIQYLNKNKLIRLKAYKFIFIYMVLFIILNLTLHFYKSNFFTILIFGSAVIYIYICICYYYLNIEIKVKKTSWTMIGILSILFIIFNYLIFIEEKKHKNLIGLILSSNLSLAYLLYFLKGLKNG